MEEEQLTSRPLPLWMGFGVWVAMLAALLVTSKHAVSMISTGGYLWQLWSQMATSAYTAAGHQAFSSTAAAMVMAGSAFILAAVVLIGSAWLKFATLSHSLIVSYAWLEEEEGGSTVFSDFLNFPKAMEEGDEEEADVDLDQAEGSLVGDMVRHLAFAWAVMLLIPAAMVVAGALL
jgi:hypothetical protein